MAATTAAPKRRVKAISQGSQKAVASALLEFDELLRSSSDPADIFNALVRTAASVVPCDGAALCLRTAAKDNWEISAVFGDTTLTQGQAFQAASLQELDPAPRLRVPLTSSAGEEFGLLLVYGKRAAKPDAVPAALEQLAHRATMVEWLRQGEVMRQQLVETNAIVEVGQVLTGLLAMEDVLSYVVYLAESLVRGHCATIALLDDERQNLILKNSTGNLRESEGLKVPVDSSLMGWVIQNGEAAMTPSLSDDPRSFQIGSRQGPAVVVPVQINGETIGAFLVARLEGAELLTHADASTLQKMASYAAIAIQNARLYREQTDAAATLRTQAEELQRAYEHVEKSQEQLLLAEKMAALGRITAGIAHEINSPLGGIMNAIRTARGYVDEYKASAGDPEITADDHIAIATDIVRSLDLAEAGASKVAQFVRSIKGQTRAGEGNTTTFDPAAEIDTTVTLLQHELRKKRVAVFTELQSGLQLTGEQSKFTSVIQNLITNSVDAYDGREGEIWVRLRKVEEQLEMEVEDKGSGIPEHIRTRIFDYLFTTKDVGKGTGLGLAMVHSIMTSTFKGQITLQSEVGVGTKFTLTFPLIKQA